MFRIATGISKGQNCERINDFWNPLGAAGLVRWTLACAYWRRRPILMLDRSCSPPLAARFRVSLQLFQVSQHVGRVLVSQVFVLF